MHRMINYLKQLKRLDLKFQSRYKRIIFIYFPNIYIFLNKKVNEEAKNSKIDDFLENFPNPFKLSHEINNERKYFTAPYDSKMSKM